MSNTVQIRWIGPKKTRIVDLPVGLVASGEKYGEVLCNPVGEFPADEARALLALPGANGAFILESEYQAAKNPKGDVAAALKKEQQRERGRKLAEGLAKKREAKKSESQPPAAV